MLLCQNPFPSSLYVCVCFSKKKQFVKFKWCNLYFGQQIIIPLSRLVVNHLIYLQHRSNSFNFLITIPRFSSRHVQNSCVRISKPDITNSWICFILSSYPCLHMTTKHTIDIFKDFVFTLISLFKGSSSPLIFHTKTFIRLKNWERNPSQITFHPLSFSYYLLSFCKLL